MFKINLTIMGRKPFELGFLTLLLAVTNQTTAVHFQNYHGLLESAKMLVHQCARSCVFVEHHQSVANYTVELLFSQIYCQGPLLEAVQKAGLFNDSKHFVDMALRNDPVSVLKKFYELGDSIHKRDVLKAFVEANFFPPGTELKDCYPEDWDPHPRNFYKIKDYHFRRWALALNRMWRDLCRQVKDDVREHPELYSLLYVPHPFIIPGGRFREFYYWDSYWIMKGLIFSEMYTTARGIIRNLAYMVEHHGFVPNGGRVYYLLRSHPPLLSPMVYEYYLATGDIDFVAELLPLLEKEYNFWLLNRGTPFYHEEEKSPIFHYFQYKASMKVPRPESYREDMELVINMTTQNDRELMWSNVASAAETGWDFSTRWFSQEGPDANHMKSIRTWSIIPVDLNAFMCTNTRILASLYEITGNLSKVLLYQARYEQAKLAMKQIHWNEEDGIWYDYDLETKKHVRVYYISNALPLFAKCYDDETVPHRVFQYMKGAGIFNFTKGVPTSLKMGSKQQWDSDNAWPPMVHMTIEGFRTSGDRDLNVVAKHLATQWLRTSYQAYIHTHAMFEKYNVSSLNNEYAGSGGEYEVQTGFGWTNGVILDLLANYGDEIAVSRSVRVSFSSLFLTILVFLHLVRR